MRSLLAWYADAVMSAAARGGGCALGCSGRGDCHNGTCLCEIRYAGEQCAGPNMPYHACIGGVFLLVSFVCAVQLTVCVAAEYRRLKAPSLPRACRLTTQKMLYIVAFLASLIRGAYFVSPSAFEEGWASSLLSAYYPLLMSGSSLIVCFWAEVFHLRDIRWERPRFLSKSFLAFVSFNLISYSLLAAEVVTTYVADTPHDKKLFYQHAFNLCYAVLLFITVIFFLIYGVEVFFKLRGEFVKETHVRTVATPRAGTADDDDVCDHLVKQGVQTDLLGGGSINARTVDLSQLHQSRLGLVSQALMLILIAGFLASETLSELWKSKVAVESRNWHDLLFRLAEIGVALWFPCVLWNCMAPERLWLLNPRRLLARQLDDARLQDFVQPTRWLRSRHLKWVQTTWHMALVAHTWIVWRVFLLLTRMTTPAALRSLEGATVETKCEKVAEEKSFNDGVKLDKILKDAQNVETSSLVASTSSRDCWICLDSERPEPLIRPCRCTGDVSSVHHACLSRWLVERSARANGLKCQVCNSPYIVQETNRVDWELGFTAGHWARSALAVVCLVASAGAAWTMVRMFTSPLMRITAYGQVMLVAYTAIRFLSTNTVTAYQRAKVSSFKILTEPGPGAPDQPPPHPAHPPPLATISESVTVEIAASRGQLGGALKGDGEK